jgi:hypothetical protein
MPGSKAGKLEDVNELGRLIAAEFRTEILKF